MYIFRNNAIESGLGLRLGLETSSQDLIASRQTKTLDSSALETRDVGIEIKRLFRADSSDIAVYQVSLLRNAAKN